jgi:hypothetical protein
MFRCFAGDYNISCSGAYMITHPRNRQNQSMGFVLLIISANYITTNEDHYQNWTSMDLYLKEGLKSEPLDKTAILGSRLYVMG